MRRPAVETTASAEPGARYAADPDSHPAGAAVYKAGRPARDGPKPRSAHGTFPFLKGCRESVLVLRGGLFRSGGVRGM